MTSGWIIGDNLRPFVEVLAWQSDSRITEGQWEAVRAGLEPTDHAAGRWAEYTFPGISLRYAWMDRQNEGTYLSVEVAASAEVELVAEALIAVMQAYRLQEDR